VLTETFGVWWPHAPHRVLRSAVEAAEALDTDHAGTRNARPIPRFAVSTPNRSTTGRVDAMALYAGQSVDAVTAIPPAADLVRELASDAERHLDRLD
jgi:hypothetical protein